MHCPKASRKGYERKRFDWPGSGKEQQPKTITF